MAFLLVKFRSRRKFSVAILVREHGFGQGSTILNSLETSTFEPIMPLHSLTSFIVSRGMISQPTTPEAIGTYDCRRTIPKLLPFLFVVDRVSHSFLPFNDKPAAINFTTSSGMLTGYQLLLISKLAKLG
jgi:hypothetical protein